MIFSHNTQRLRQSSKDIKRKVKTQNKVYKTVATIRVCVNPDKTEEPLN